MGQHRVAHDAQAQAAASGLPGAGLVHPVEAGEDVEAILLRDADAGVGNGEGDALVVPLQPDVDAAPGDIVFDGVFHQVEDNVVQIILRGEDQAAVLQLGFQTHVLLPGQRPQGVQGVLDHLFHVHQLLLLLYGVVQPGERQKLVGGALEALGLVADIGDEFPHGGRVHVLVLHDTVRQEADGGQGGLQLMGSVGDEAPALLLRGLQPLGELVELLPQLGDLVPPPVDVPVAVVPVSHHAHGAHDGPDPLHQEENEEQRQDQRQSADAQRGRADPVLEAQDDLRPLLVMLGEIEAPRQLSLGAEGNGDAADKGRVPEGGAKNDLALQTAEQILRKLALSRGVIEAAALPVRHQDTGIAAEIQIPQHLRDILPVQPFQTGQGGGHGGSLGRHGAALFLKHRVPGRDQRIGVQQQQKNQQQGRDEGDKLCTDTVHGRLLRFDPAGTQIRNTILLFNIKLSESLIILRGLAVLSFFFPLRVDIVMSTATNRSTIVPSIATLRIGDLVIFVNTKTSTPEKTYPAVSVE